MARWCLLLAIPLVFSTCSSSRPAARPPTRHERKAILNALPAPWRNPSTGCVKVDIRVSHDSRFAFVAHEFLNPHDIPPRCMKYASNGFWIVKEAPRWRIVYEGSEPPPCSMKIPDEILAPVHCLER